MKAQLTIQVQVNQPGQWGNGLQLSDVYQLEVNTLSEAALILVKLHEACNEAWKLSQRGRVKEG